MSQYVASELYVMNCNKNESAEEPPKPNLSSLLGIFISQMHSQQSPTG
jgi:hypothetical protein